MGYTKITQEEAKHIMDTKDNIIILDVRNPEEFVTGHIKGAINVPNPSITNREIPELPDKKQEILVYCRSGQRSQIASKKLVVLGYENIKDFGGIMDWKYDVES
nr:rhodanese-like domain-containing protein [uncultured Sellimonas sp.]